MADSLSKIGAMLESARDLTLEAASSASARLMDETPLQPKDITTMLNGRTERERMGGMKQVISVCYNFLFFFGCCIVLTFSLF